MNRDNLNTKLEKACQMGSLVLVKKLVAAGADIHCDTDFPVCLAAEYGHLEIVKYLHSIGADIYVDENWPVYVAITKGHLETVKYLVENGAKVVEASANWASQNSHEDVAMYIMSLYDPANNVER